MHEVLHTQNKTTVKVRVASYLPLKGAELWRDIASALQCPLVEGKGGEGRGKGGKGKGRGERGKREGREREGGEREGRGGKGEGGKGEGGRSGDREEETQNLSKCLGELITNLIQVLEYSSS